MDERHLLEKSGKRFPLRNENADSEPEVDNYLEGLLDSALRARTKVRGQNKRKGDEDGPSRVLFNDIENSNTKVESIQRRERKLIERRGKEDEEGNREGNLGGRRFFRAKVGEWCENELKHVSKLDQGSVAMSEVGNTGFNNDDLSKNNNVGVNESGSARMNNIDTARKPSGSLGSLDVSFQELFPDMAEYLEEGDAVNGGLSSYDLISRTLHQVVKIASGRRETLRTSLVFFIVVPLARDGNSIALASVLARLGDEAAARIDQLDEDKLAPLHYSARYSHPGAITALLQAGACVNVTGHGGLTPLHCATRYRKPIKSAKSARRFPSTHVPDKDDNHEDDKDEDDKDRELEELEQEILLQEKINELNSSSEAPIVVLKASYGKPTEDSVVRLLVENGAETNAEDSYGLTPLHYACMRGNDVALRDLLSFPQVDLEPKDKQQMTPLCLAAIFGFPDSVRQLLLAGAHLTVKDEKLQTPLHKAAEEGHLEIAELLVESCRRRGELKQLAQLVSAKDCERQTALYMAVANGHVELSRLLLREGADPNVTNDSLATPVHAAAAAGSEDLVELLVKFGGRVDAVDVQQQTPLHRAAALNRPDAVRRLLHHGARIERRDRHSFTPLLLAVSEGQFEATVALFDAGADVTVMDKNDRTVVHWCSANGSVKILQILRINPAFIELLDLEDRSGNSPLHEAARRGHTEVVAALLDAGSHIDNKNEDEESALHVAAEAGQDQVVQELVKRHRFLVNDEDEDSNKPLHLACLKGHSAVVRTLLKAGADVGARNTLLWTPLDCASSAGHTDCCLLLLEYGSPLDPVDKRRTTPLQLAGIGGHVDVVETLLNRGASLSACDSTGRNALELSIAAGKKEVVMAMLRSSQWQDALRHCRISTRGRRLTPFRMLVRRFPEAAELVMDKCTTANGIDPEKINFGIKFNFEFLDDSYQIVGEGENCSSVGASFEPKPAFDENGQLLSPAQLYTTDMRELKRNHPLMLMVHHRRQALLGHPVAVALVKHKWITTGRYLYYINLTFYIVFLILLTGYALDVPDWASVNMALYNNASAIPSNCHDAEEKLKLSHSVIVRVGKWVILATAILNIARELLQLYQFGVGRITSRLNYLGVGSLLEWGCYVCAVLLVYDFNDCLIRENWQWQVGTAAIFLAWINLLMFIRKFPYFGIYVVMFTDVLATFSKFFIVFFLFIIAFALSFLMVFKNQPAFPNSGKALLKTGVMMIGELEFDALFNDPDNPLPYPGVTFPLYTAFLILMSILLMNLLIGLAVDDIKAVQEQAVLKRLGMQTELVLGVETILPDFVRRLSARAYKIVHPNAQHSLLSRLFAGSRIMESIQFHSTSDEMSEVERLGQTMQDLTAQVEELRAQSSRTQVLLTTLITLVKDGQKRLEERGSKGGDGDEAASL